MVEADPALEWRQIDCARPLLDVVLRVEEIEDLLGGAQCLLEIVVELPKLAHRLVQS